MPQDRSPTDFNHRFRFELGFFPEPCSQPATQDHDSDILPALKKRGSPARAADHIALHELSSQRYTDGCARQPLLLIEGNTSNRRYLTS